MGSIKEAKDVRYCYYHKANSHNLINCKAFSNLTDERNEFIKKTKLCFRCLPPKHIAAKCNSKRHPTLLHKERTESIERKKVKVNKGTVRSEQRVKVKKRRTYPWFKYHQPESYKFHTASKTNQKRFWFGLSQSLRFLPLKDRGLWFEIAIVTATQHQFAPCSNNFFGKDPSFGSWNETHVFQKTERDNEPSLSIADRRFVEIMEAGACKNEVRNWELPLPLRANVVSFLNYREFVLNRFKNLTILFEKKPQMEADYFKFMLSLLRTWSCTTGRNNPPREVASCASTSSNVRYLPRLGVYHNRKLEKICVVFDASAVFQGKSLNREFLPGPDSLINLLGILLRFRKRRSVLSATSNKCSMPLRLLSISRSNALCVV